MHNITEVTGFFLAGFSDDQDLQTVCGVLFLVMYLAALMNNLVLITLITVDLKLQTPMYFFLKNLSLMDAFVLSVPIPNFIVNSLSHNYSISIPGCAFQILLMASFSAAEVFILTAMSYDRYVAICLPLHYEAIMSGRVCLQMAGISWATGGLLGALYTAGTFSMPFCGSNVIPQFFCDIPSLLRISCSEMLMVTYIGLGIGFCLGIFCFICVIISYSYIFSTVLKIPSTKGQSKAFSTCVPHLIVFSVYILTAYFVYLKSPSDIPSIIDKLSSVIYTLLPPALNPVIYSLRNTDVKCALWRLFKRLPSTGSLHLTLQHLCLWLSASEASRKFHTFLLRKDKD